MDKILTSLTKLPVDLRDLSHNNLYGSIPLSSIPQEDFSVSPIPPIILNQIDLDFCTAEASSELNTKFQYSDVSLVNYLNSKKQDSSLGVRAQLAVKYSLVPDTFTYLNMAKISTNGPVNLQILASLMFDNGDYFDPLYQFAKIKQGIGGDPMVQGANLRDAANALVNYGSLPKNQSPFTYDENKPSDQSRDFLANWNNWPANLDAIASAYKLGSYLTTDGPYDAFDNICSALYTNFLQKVPCGVIFGLNWRPEWVFAEGGIINENYATSSGGGHAVYLIGVSFINSIPYIVCQNSWGKAVGNRGLYFLPRNVINTEFSTGYGSFIFKKQSALMLKYYNEVGIKVPDSFFTKAKKIISNL